MFVVLLISRKNAVLFQYGLERAFYDFLAPFQDMHNGEELAWRGAPGTDAQQHQQGKKRQVLAQVNRDLFSTQQSAQLKNIL